MSKKTTNIESIMIEVLKSVGVSFRREFKVGNYPVDFYLPDYDFSIQVDGVYYHGNCNNCVSEIKENSRQIFQKRRDKACISFHRYNKVNIVRVCECQLMYNRKSVKKIINTCLNTISKGEKIYYDRGEI